MTERGNSAQRGYDNRWRKARDAYLRKHPLCAMCWQMGRTTIATVVDHIEPHKGDMQKFWDKDNWQPLCAPCHDRHKKRLEMSGKLAGCTSDGTPLDPGHHWNRGKGG